MQTGNTRAFETTCTCRLIPPADSAGVQWPSPLTVAGLSPEALGVEASQDDIASLGQVVLSSLSVHDELRQGVSEGLCLFTVASQRSHSGNTMDIAKAESVFLLIKEKILQAATEVGSSSTSMMAQW